MGRSPCCDKVGLKKGPWTPEEDQKLLAYIEAHGHGSWRALPAKAGLQRCGKSCRLRWTNYLRPDIKRGKFSLQEEQTIIQLHALLGNRWSAIATYLPKRTDNEIKNYWNTHLKKRLTKMGIDPVTHKPKTDALGPGHIKDAANLSHMAQWESARLEAEARLVRESKLLVSNNPYNSQVGGSSSAELLHKAATAPPPPPLCLDILKAWQGGWAKGVFVNSGVGTLESPTSTLNFSENVFLVPSVASFNDNLVQNMKIETQNEWKCLGKQSNFQEPKQGIENLSQFTEVPFPTDNTWITDTMKATNANTLLPSFMESFTDPMLHDNWDINNSSSVVGNSNNIGNSNNVGQSCSGDFEENKNYWNNILNLVNATPSGSPVF